MRQSHQTAALGGGGKPKDIHPFFTETRANRVTLKTVGTKMNLERKRLLIQ